MALYVLVLGSAAGGGFPQWNCGCRNCAAVRAKVSGLLPRTQDSVAVSADRRRWFLLNASPDIGKQIRDNPQLWPRSLRDSPISGVVLTNGDLDHVLGLLHLRESQPLSVYATARVRSGLERNVFLRTLQRFDGQLRWQTLELERTCELQTAAGVPCGVHVTPVAVPGKPPLHLAADCEPALEDNVALRVRTTSSGVLTYASAVADAKAALPQLQGSAALLMDGTFWSEAELPDMGIAMGPARSMAHQPVGGPEGSLAALNKIDAARRIYTHLNNTNPMLDPDSAQYERVVSAGWEVARDGLKLTVE
jgi:pyrroloquinoline quinone biosynthesis protein B